MTRKNLLGCNRECEGRNEWEWIDLELGSASEEWTEGKGNRINRQQTVMKTTGHQRFYSFWRNSVKN